MPHRELIANIPSLPFILHLRFMTTGEDRNNDRFRNWKVCFVWKTLFRHHGAKKLMQNCVCFYQSVYQPLFRLLSLVNTIPRYLKVSTCCSVFVLTCRKHCLGETYVIPQSFRADFRFFLVARSRKPIKGELKTLFRRSTHAVPVHPQKQNGSYCSSQQCHPCVTVDTIHIDQGSSNFWG